MKASPTQLTPYTFVHAYQTHLQSMGVGLYPCGVNIMGGDAYPAGKPHASIVYAPSCAGSYPTQIYVPHLNGHPSNAALACFGNAIRPSWKRSRLKRAYHTLTNTFRHLQDLAKRARAQGDLPYDKALRQSVKRLTYRASIAKAERLFEIGMRLSPSASERGMILAGDAFMESAEMMDEPDAKALVMELAAAMAAKALATRKGAGQSTLARYLVWTHYSNDAVEFWSAALPKKPDPLFDGMRIFAGIARWHASQAKPYAPAEKLLIRSSTMQQSMEGWEDAAHDLLRLAWMRLAAQPSPDETEADIWATTAELIQAASLTYRKQLANRREAGRLARFAKVAHGFRTTEGGI